MTPPSSLVVSLENAKALKEAGFPQGQTEFYYVSQRGEWDLYTDCNCDQCWTRSSFRTKADAPTAEEILRKLPMEEPRCAHVADLVIAPFQTTKGDKWKVAYEEQGVGCHIKFEEDTLANAAAQMYIHLSTHHLL